MEHPETFFVYAKPLFEVDFGKRLVHELVLHPAVVTLLGGTQVLPWTDARLRGQYFDQKLSYVICLGN